MSVLERSDLRDVRAYAPAELAGVDLDLRDNVNPWGVPPGALRAIATVAGGVSRYPEVDARALREAIARDAGVRADEVVVGCGSDDVIDSFLRAMAAPGERVAHSEPTFGMIPAFARLSGLVPVGVPSLADGAADIDGLLASGARVIYLCSPNNPTGCLTAAREIRRLIECAPGVVLLDEAYAEFADVEDQRVGAPARGNVLVTRTFSKAWGLAGLRVGYGVGEAALTASVAKARGPYKVNAVAAAAADAALREDVPWMRARAAEARAIREELVSALAARPRVHAGRSHGNFVFAAIDDPAAQVAKRFAELGIGVRAFEWLPGIGAAVRFGLVERSVIPRLVRAFDEVWPCA
jgi:histidinol-phosphate aminotransferase